MNNDTDDQNIKVIEICVIFIEENELKTNINKNLFIIHFCYYLITAVEYFLYKYKILVVFN